MSKILFIGAIKVYQRIRVWTHPRTCRFTPSCSQYAVDALQKHGLYKGAWQSLTRLLRCSPLFPGGHDPVR